MEAKLLKIEGELRALKATNTAKRLKLLQQHLDERESVLKRRYELVSGQSAATEAELEGFTGPRTTGPIKPQGLPCFWLNALCAADEVSGCVTAADRDALAHLQDVRFLKGTAGWAGMMLEFHFSPDNPYFDNLVLRRGLSLVRGPNGEVVDVQEDATPIEWREGRNLTVRTVNVRPKKAKKKGGKKRAGKGAPASAAGDDPGEGEGEGLTRVKAVPSFFRFFLPLQRRKVADPTALDDGEAEEDMPLLDEDEGANEPGTGLGGADSDGGSDGGGAGGGMGARELAEAQAARRKAERDVALIDAIIKRVIPRSVHLYLAAPQGTSPEEEDESGYTMISSAAAAAHGGGPALYPAAQQALHALQRQQAQLDEMCLQLKRDKWSLDQETDAAEQKLMDARAALLTSPQRGNQTGCGTSPPLFWLRALRASEAGAPCVALRDELALSALIDVRARCDWGHMPTLQEPWRKVAVEWVFQDNPYFPAVTLSKVYTLTCQGGSSSELTLDQAGQITCSPKWISDAAPCSEAVHGTDEGAGGGVGTPGGCDLTLSPPVARTGKAANKPVPATSFFNLFKQGCLRHAFSGLGDSGAGPDEAALAAEVALVECVMAGPLRYTPTQLYQQVEIEEHDLGHEWNECDEEDEEASDNGTDEDEEEEEAGKGGEGDEDKAVRRRRRTQKRAVASSWWPSNGMVFVGLMMLMVFGQMVVYIEMWMRPRGHAGYA